MGRYPRGCETPKPRRQSARSYDSCPHPPRLSPGSQAGCSYRSCSLLGFKPPPPPHAVPLLPSSPPPPPEGSVDGSVAVPEAPTEETGTMTE
ncbi:hypothetical protein DPEC_G00335780 [Dallia pectoralis]|uniref:Uncharacterized protein n=1 Tax=Dallia pectoralis TaxID=75939 RepID=A0ACC2F732_DALPE|nr:hypothetical protein DPEC_G00335780 [Dallia pectoralis]